MSKRVAQKQLTLENFEEEEEEEVSDSGPKLATDEVLKRRPIIKAKRRSDLNASLTDGQPKTAFTGFGGFSGLNPTSLENKSSFSAFNSMISDSTESQLNRPLTSLTQTNGNQSVGQQRTTTATTTTTPEEDMDEIYHQKLNDLNKCFIKHINSYLKQSLNYDLSQVCNEYIEYQKSIESETKCQNRSDSEVTASSSATVSAIPEPKSGVNFGAESQITSDTGFGSQLSFKLNNPVIQSPFLSQTNTGLSPASTGISSQASIGSSLLGNTGLSSQISAGLSTPKSTGILTQTSLGLLSQSSTNETQFAKPNLQFSATVKPFTGFGTGSPAPTSAATETNEEESEDPPKVESIEHKEPNCVYTKKCKLFFQKSNEWQTKGLGFLYIKKEATATSAQLLIRADNKLAKILLHITLNETLPISKTKDSTGILLSCIPNPPIDPKAKSEDAVSFLIRVKKGDTDEVFNQLLKYKSI